MEHKNGIFIHAQAPQKQEARNLVLSYYDGESMFSLPANNFIFEQMAAKKCYNGQAIHGFEIKKQIYQSGIPLADKLHKKYPTLNYYKDDVFNLNMSQYDFGFLDLCGNLCPSTLEKIFSLLQSIKYGKVFITLMKGREFYFPERVVKLWRGYDGLRELYFPYMVYKHTKFTEIMNMFEYKNEYIIDDLNGKKEVRVGVPMMLWGFERKRK